MTKYKFEDNTYVGVDGLLYCLKCNEPKEAYFKGKTSSFLGLTKHSLQCACMRKINEEETMKQIEREHLRQVSMLRQDCFIHKKLVSATFEQSGTVNHDQIKYAIRYVDNWEEMKRKNIGLLFWGDVGTGKTYLAACMANALIEKEVPVKMINLNSVLSMEINDRHKFINSLSKYDLLIIDDFGSERCTEYGLEIVFSVLDARYESDKPMIVTTNRNIQEFKNETITDFKRIYDRLQNCVPVRVTGESLRTGEGLMKKNDFKELIK